MEINKEFIGQIVLVRSIEAGVYYGTLEAMNGAQVKLRNVRNIWSWSGATCLAQVAVDGIKKGQVSQNVAEMVINGACQVIPMTPEAIESLNNMKPWTC